MSGLTTHQVSKFFVQILKSHPNVIRETGMLGAGLFLEDHRVNMLVAANDEYTSINLLFYPDLWGQIYRVARDRIDVMLAVYGDQILWLDNHSDNTDYEAFLQRERLLSWIPERLEAFLKLLIETNFSYLHRVLLINNASDIPPIPDRRKSLAIQIETLQEAEACLNSLSSELHSPTIRYDELGNMQLAFFI